MKEYIVTQTVSLKLREEAFTDEFMAEFRESFYPFFELRDHAEHICQLVARGVMGEVFRGASVEHSEFVEGYGPIGEFVESAQIENVEVE